MKIRVQKFQEGGEMAPQEEAPMNEAPQEEAGAPEGGQDPVMQLVQLAAQAVQKQDCEAALAACQGLLQLIQAGQGGGAPQEAPQGEPVYRAGGKLVGRIRG